MDRAVGAVGRQLGGLFPCSVFGSQSHLFLFTQKKDFRVCYATSTFTQSVAKGCVTFRSHRKAGIIGRARSPDVTVAKRVDTRGEVCGEGLAL